MPLQTNHEQLVNTQEDSIFSHLPHYDQYMIASFIADQPEVALLTFNEVSEQVFD